MTVEFYYGSWILPDAADLTHASDEWPTNMIGFCSGSGDGYTNWVGFFVAESAKGCWDILKEAYGPDAFPMLEERIEFEARDADKPPSDRWQGAAPWLAARRSEVAS